jgi:hypothetical protein
MSSSEALGHSRLARRSALAAGAAALALCLAGCSGFAPVYGDHGLAAAQRGFAYAAPHNRPEQIIYQQLALKLGRGGDPQNPTIAVAATTRNRDLTKSDVARPSDQWEADISAVVTVTDASGQVVFTATRSASALYATDGQGLADAEAANEATDRAARELAETIRLTLLGALAAPAG